MGNDIEKQLQEKIAEMESEVDKRIEEEKAEEEDKVWPGDLFGVTRQMQEDDSDTFLVEVPGADYSEVVADVRAWRDDVMGENAPDNVERIAQLAELIEEARRRRAALNIQIKGFNIQIEDWTDERRKLHESNPQAAWNGPVRAILKPHEGELNKAVEILYSQVTEVGLNRSGRITRSSSPVDGEVPDQTGLEMDSPPTRKEVQDMFVAVERLKRWLESPASE